MTFFGQAISHGSSVRLKRLEMHERVTASWTTDTNVVEVELEEKQLSWNRYLRGIQWFTLFQGVWTEDSTGDIPFNQTLTQSLVGKGLREVPGASYLQRATNVYGPGVSRVLRKRPGFSKIQSTTINAAGIWTGFVHLGEIADKFYGTASIV